MARSSSLAEKLRRIERLRQGATTAGELRAAEAAVERIAARLKAEGRCPGEVARGPSAGSCAFRADDPLYAAESMPTVARLREVLGSWAAGDITTRGVHRWAAHLVDKVYLDVHPPDDPRSVPVEILLQLSSMGLLPLEGRDVPHILSFLDAEPSELEPAWRCWFEWLERKQRLRRQRRARVS